MYNELVEGDEGFTGFNFTSRQLHCMCLECRIVLITNFSLGFRDPANKAVTKALIGQVQTLNPEFQAAQIRGK